MLGEGRARAGRRPGLGGGEEGRARRCSGAEREREGRKGKKEKGKRVKEKENGEKGEREKGKKGGAVRASGDCGRGRPRGCGPREMGHAAGKEGEREKGGAGFAAAGHDASRWMGKRWDAD